MKRRDYILALVLPTVLFCWGRLGAQSVAVKSDLLSGVLTSPNLALEVKLSERLSLEAGVHYNPFSAGEDKRWKHWFVQPELRYWMCRPYGGHFFGAHLVYGVYNVGNIKLPMGLFKKIRSARYEGDFMGVGLSYGYHFILSPHWGLETSIGIGFVHTRNEEYRCSHCGEKTGRGNRNFIAPTKAAVSLVYVIR